MLNGRVDRFTLPPAADHARTNATGCRANLGADGKGCVSPCLAGGWEMPLDESARISNACSVRLHRISIRISEAGKIISHAIAPVACPARCHCAGSCLIDQSDPSTWGLGGKPDADRRAHRTGAAARIWLSRLGRGAFAASLNTRSLSLMSARALPRAISNIPP